MSSQIHDFNDCLALSHSVSDLSLWLDVYRQFFPDMVGFHDHRDDGWHQRQGIDRSIVLANSKQYLIDEKYRSVDYGDILLEYLSNDKTHAMGWVCKSIQCDFIAYAIGPRGKAYLLPVLQLQAAWRVNEKNWKTKYGTKVAKNHGYNTLSCPVPFKPLFSAITTAQIATFTPTTRGE